MAMMKKMSVKSSSLHLLVVLLSFFILAFQYPSAEAKTVRTAAKKRSHHDNDEPTSNNNKNLLHENFLSFHSWQLYYQKNSYATAEEYEQRKSIWLENKLHVSAHNQAYEQGYTSYKKTMASPFADLTDDEFSSAYLMQAQDCSATTHPSSGRLRSSSSTSTTTTTTSTSDDCQGCHCCYPSVDWRTKGIFTPVKDQGKCGSCWTFSTSGCLEAHTCLASQKDCTHWTGLAEEQLLECAGDFNNHGCDGGLPSQAFEYLKYSGVGMATEKDYPYTANKDNRTCHVPSRGWRAHVAEVFNITSRDEEDLQHAIVHVGPVSVAYQVSSDFRFYSHGVYDSYNHTTNETVCKDGNHDVNHAVVAVGLGTTAKTGEPYYIVRNSWSRDWGMEGHFWIKRGSNLCGISDCASFPIVPTNNAAAALGWREEEKSAAEASLLLRG